MTEKQQSQTQPPPFNLAPKIQAELTTLNVHYRDMQKTMSHLITILTGENAELKTENTNLKKPTYNTTNTKQHKCTQKNNPKPIKQTTTFFNST
ncbi:MAG: hypothetical protein FWH37_10125 [Candidatus Bathyarchaeota archaeon]|nr:hypothetical protein [Candidatus Termiticorpusculum sp.]